MVARMWVSWPLAHECERSYPATHLLWGDTGTVMPSTPRSHELRKAIATPHQLQYLGQQALLFTWTA